MRSDSDSCKPNPRLTASDLTYPRNQMIRQGLYLRAAEPPKIFLQIVLDTPQSRLEYTGIQAFAAIAYRVYLPDV